jgi:hypothetical protein
MPLVRTPDDEKDFSAPDLCFYCAKVIRSYPYVTWKGTARIGFHIECCEKLTRRLTIDLLNVELVGAGKPPVLLPATAYEEWEAPPTTLAEAMARPAASRRHPTLSSRGSRW